jgi:uncharacterized membrane protein
VLSGLQAMWASGASGKQQRAVMVGKLASQIAGYKLSWIISVLLLPFLAICYLTTSSLRANLYETNRSLAGLAIHRQVVPLLFQYGLEDTGNLPKSLDEIIKSTLDTDVTGKLEAVRSLASTGTASPRVISRKFADAIFDMSFKSGMAGDAGAESVYLASIAARQTLDVLV